MAPCILFLYSLKLGSFAHFCSGWAVSLLQTSRQIYEEVCKIYSFPLSCSVSLSRHIILFLQKFCLSSFFSFYLSCEWMDAFERTQILLAQGQILGISQSEIKCLGWSWCWGMGQGWCFFSWRRVLFFLSLFYIGTAYQIHHVHFVSYVQFTIFLICESLILWWLSWSSVCPQCGTLV